MNTTPDHHLDLDPDNIEKGVPPEMWRYVDAFRRALPKGVAVEATTTVFELITALQAVGPEAVGALTILRDVCKRFYVTKFYALLRSNPETSRGAANATFWARRVVSARF